MKSHPIKDLPDLSGWLAIAWFEHRRTRTLCFALNLSLSVLETKHRGFVRWGFLASRTLVLLRRRKPRTLIVQNPSIAAAMLSLIFRPVFRYRLIIDAHNEAICPYKHNNALVRAVSRWLIRGVDITVVTNESLAAEVKRIGGTPFVLFDCIPERPPGLEIVRPSKIEVLVVSTFSRDEPIDEIIGAARLLPQVQFRFTGQPTADIEAKILPSNARLTGLLSDRDYWSAMGSTSLVLDLTDRQDCLVCGAYEALALSKPLILTDCRVARELFKDGASYTANEADAIAEVILAVALDLASRSLAAHQAAVRLKTEWRVAVAGLLTAP